MTESSPNEEKAEAAAKEPNSEPKPESETEAAPAKASNPLWTYLSFLFLVLLMLVMSHSIYELLYGTAEDQQLQVELQEAFEKNQVQLDLLDARLRAQILSQFDESKQETIIRALAKLASRPNGKDLDQSQRLLYLNARQVVLSEAETLLRDGKLSQLEKMSFVGLLQTALDKPERLLENTEENQSVPSQK